MKKAKWDLFQIIGKLTYCNLNGYRHYGMDKGIHLLSKKTETGYYKIAVSASDIMDGSVEYMTRHDISRITK